MKNIKKKLDIIMKNNEEESNESDSNSMDENKEKVPQEVVDFFQNCWVVEEVLGDFEKVVDEFFVDHGFQVFVVQGLVVDVDFEEFHGLQENFVVVGFVEDDFDEVFDDVFVLFVVGVVFGDFF
jgi:hypothetical protein